MRVRRTEKRKFSEAKKILIRGTNWIGDAVMTLPALSAIRRTFSDAWISILVLPRVAEIYRLSRNIDDLILYQKPGDHEGIRGMFKLAHQLKREKFDAAILLQNAIEAAIIALLAGIPIRAGYNTDGRGLLLTHCVKRTEEIQKVHQKHYYLEMVRSLGCTTDETDIHLTLGEEYKEIARALQECYGIVKQRPLVGFAPGATYGPAKRWFPERFAAVAERFINDFNAQVVILGNRDDERTARMMEMHCRFPLLNLAGKTDLQQAISLTSLCDLFISNDSGLMHIAGALNIPTVAIFGSTNPVTTSPPGECSVVIYRNAPCSPCLRETCPTDFRCMEEIRVEDVYDIARNLLKTKGVTTFS